MYWLPCWFAKMALTKIKVLEKTHTDMNVCTKLYPSNGCSITSLKVPNVHIMAALEEKSIHRYIVCNRFIPFLWGRGGFWWSQPQLSLGEGRVHSGQVASSSQGPHWWQGPPTAHQGSVSCSRTLRHEAQLSLGLGFEPFDLQITSQPALPSELQP